MTNILGHNSSAGRIKPSVRPSSAASTTGFPFVFFIVQILMRCAKISVRPLMHTAAPRDNPGSAVITAGRADDFMWKSNHGISGTFCFFPGEMMFLGKETEPVPEAEPKPPPLWNYASAFAFHSFYKWSQFHFKIRRCCKIWLQRLLIRKNTPQKKEIWEKPSGGDDGFIRT